MTVDLPTNGTEHGFWRNVKKQNGTTINNNIDTIYQYNIRATVQAREGKSNIAEKG